MSFLSKTFEKFKLFICVSTWITLIVGATVLLSLYLIGTLDIPFMDKTAQAQSTDVFDSVVELTEKKVSRYLGDSAFQEPKIPGHFHHIGRWYQSDDLDFCIKCHGPIPHSKIPKQRAFLNMHSLFISCITCHVREKEGIASTSFGWINIEDGKSCPNPTMSESFWGEYGAKIVPLKDSKGKSRPLTLEDEVAFAQEFIIKKEKLNDNQKVIGNKFIHRRNIETPVGCSNCHNSQDTFLPYTDLGYSLERSGFLMSAEVANLAKHYETFYLPNLLKTKQTPKDSEKSTE